MLENLEKTELIELIYKLEKENKELKEKLYGFNTKSEIIEKNTKNNISNEEKIKLFMSIFKARTDVYAKRCKYLLEYLRRSRYSNIC